MIKPLCDIPLEGPDEHVFSMANKVRRVLRQHGFKAEAQEVKERLPTMESYEEAVVMFKEYVIIPDREF